MTSVIGGPADIADAPATGETAALPVLEEPAPTNIAREMLVIVAIAIALPLLGFWVVRPDWFYQLNGLDSYFYTGYAQNLGEVMAVSGDMHYFVSRWSAYLPNRLFFNLFGAEPGFLVLRWLYASVICLAILAIGRSRWRRTDAIALTILVLLTPMLLRSVLSDYVDSLTIPAGIACITVVALRPRSRWVAAVAGGLAAAIFVANPLALAIVLSLLPAWIRELRWSKNLAASFVIATATFAGVLGAGLLYFRVRFGIPNVYAPTIDFMRTATGRDALKSTRLEWLGDRIWIYLPLIVLATWQYLARVAKAQFDSAERIIMTTCAVQYAFQIAYQFGRDGTTLEIPYYWSMIVPVMILSTCVIIAKLVATAPRALLLVVAGVVLVWILGFRSNMPEIYGSWFDAAIVTAIAALAWWRLGPYAHSFGACSLVFLIFTFQVGAPRPDYSSRVETRVAASYDTVYDVDGSYGVDGYRAATWLSEQMKSLGSPLTESAYFWIGGGRANAMAAAFNAHVTGRWLNPGWGSDSRGLRLLEDFTWAIGAKIVNTVVMLGTTSDIATMTENLDEIRPGYRVVFEGVSPDDAHTRVRVLTYG